MGQDRHRDLEVGRTDCTDITQAASSVSVVAHNIFGKLPGALEIQGCAADGVRLQKGQAHHHTVHQESGDTGLPICVMVHANARHPQGRP